MRFVVAFLTAACLLVSAWAWEPRTDQPAWLTELCAEYGC